MYVPLMHRLNRLQKFSSPLVCTCPSHILFGMVDNLVGKFAFQTFVGLQRIGIEIRPRFNVFLHELVKWLFLPSGRNGNPDVTFTFKQSNHDSFTTAASALD